MSFNADAVILTLFALVAVNVLGVVAYALAIKLKARRKANSIVAIRSTILEYFRRSGVEVSVDCADLGNGRYMAMVESEPMKRFRLSHIIEMTLREHVHRNCGIELDKVYWRFPVKQAVEQAVEQVKPAKNSDDYINEGLEHYRHIPQPVVEELSWEHFEQVVGASTEGKEKS